MKGLRAVFWFAGVAALVGGAWAGVNRYRQGQATLDLPVAPARLGDFLAIIRTRGEIKARRSVQIYAPIVPNLRIAWMAPPGEPVEQGKPVIRFDSSSAQQQLVQKEAQLRQAQATLDQALAQARITSQKDESDLADSKYGLERAKLQPTTGEFISRIEAENNRIDVGLAEQKVKVQEATTALHATSDKSKVSSLTRQRDQAQAEVELYKRRIADMEMNAPLTGYVTFASNYSQGSINARPFRIGDNVFSGMNLAELPDLASLQMDAKVEEVDRGKIEVGNDVRVRVDAVPELTITCKITQISPMAELAIEYPLTRSFRAYAALQDADKRLRPGMNGSMDIVINRIPKAITIPAKALFTRGGKPVVYTGAKGKYTPVEVRVLARNPDEVAVTGIAADAMVALVDPEPRDAKK